MATKESIDIANNQSSIVNRLLVVKTMSSDPVIKSYNEISSYSSMYEKEIADAVEELGNFARYNEIMCEVRSTIYNIYMFETINSYFMSSMTLEEAIEEFTSKYISESEYVCYPTRI